MICIRKNYWKTSIIWSKWKEYQIKNIQLPNTKRMKWKIYNFSFKRRNISTRNDDFIETITMNYIFWKMIQNIYFKQWNHKSFQKKMIRQLKTIFKKHCCIQYDLFYLTITIILFHLLFIQFINIIHLNKVMFCISIHFHRFKVT